jgi:hypothetical protein
MDPPGNRIILVPGVLYLVTQSVVQPAPPSAWFASTRRAVP